MKNIYFLPFSFILIFFCPSSYSQDNKNNELVFISRIVDFGLVPSDTLLTASYIVKNRSSIPIAIKYVQPDCICTASNVSKTLIQPQEESTITLVFDTANKFGKQKIYAVVNTSSSIGMYKLTLKAEIYERKNSID